MIEKVVMEINKTLVTLQETYSFQQKRLWELRDKEVMVLSSKKSPSGKKYYCARKKGETRFRYAGAESEKEINDIKEAKYLKKSLSCLETDIKLLNKAASGLLEVDYKDINALLPAVYRDPQLKYGITDNEKALNWKKRMEAIKAARPVYRPEELKVRTDDGNYVRSKSEAMIYNHLLALGISFIYEMPINVNGFTYLADFVLLSEVDFKTAVIIEHQGMMDDPNYRKRFTDKLYGYLKAGYKPGINIFFTFDTLNGGFDKTPIENIIRNHIRPVY